MTILRVGIAGLGTVGGGLFRLLVNQTETIAERCGRTISVTAISARDRDKERDLNLSGIKWHEDAVSQARDENVDVVCELIGGTDGIALQVCESALSSGKDVVTANKAMLAVHGVRLASLAEKHDVEIYYEAAVAGGIPIIKSIREGKTAIFRKKYRNLDALLIDDIQFISTKAVSYTHLTLPTNREV